MLEAEVEVVERTAEFLNGSMDMDGDRPAVSVSAARGGATKHQTLKIWRLQHRRMARPLYFRRFLRSIIIQNKHDRVISKVVI